MKNKVLDWLDEKVGWRKVKGVLLDRKIPKGVNWNYTLGSMLAFLFLMQAFTGMLLAMHYSPSPDHAYDSIRFLSAEIPMGGLLRSIHHWGSSAMIVVVVLHMLRTFFMGAYKHPRELTWISGVGLLLVVLGLGFTGYLLPWDQKAYWATMVGSKIAAQTPWIGPMVSKIMMGGEELGAVTLTRFYAIHMLVLPAAFLGIVFLHLFLVVWHGISAPPERLHDDAEDWNVIHWKVRLQKRYEELKAQGKAFFPHIIAKDTIAIALLFTVVLFVAWNFGAALEEMADPTATDYNPRPEWYFLFMFEALKYFPGHLEALGTVVLPGLALTVLLLLPFLDGGPRRHPLDRPWWVASGALALTGVVVLTIQGLRAPSTNQQFKKNEKAMAGKRLYGELRCASCHSIDGRGGIVGPALDNAFSHRGKEWIAEHFREPRKLSPGTRMPNFKLLDREIDELTEFIISLEGGPYSENAPKLFEKHCLECHALKGKRGDDSGPDLDSVGREREQGWIAAYIRDPDKLYPDAEMSGFASEMSEEEIEDLSRYLSAQRAKSPPGKKPAVKPAR